MSRHACVMGCVFVVWLAGLGTAAADPTLSGRHAIGVFGGAWNDWQDPAVTVGVTGVEVVGDGGVGGLRYDHWWREGWAFDLSIATMSRGDVRVLAWEGVTSQSVRVTWVQFGVRRYLSAGAFDGRVRPFASASLGPVVVSADGVSVQSDVIIGSNDDASLGGTVGLGCDVLLSRHVVLEATATYGVMGRFREPYGGRDEYDGGMGTVGISALWGGEP